MIGFDTNVVVRLMVEDDEPQVRRARRLLEEVLYPRLEETRQSKTKLSEFRGYQAERSTARHSQTPRLYCTPRAPMDQRFPDRPH